MNDFTASNGGTVDTTDSGRMIVTDLTPFEYSPGVTRTRRSSYLDPGPIVTLREFFQAEADERLGRWRWPADPEFVVYPEGEMVCVTNERTGHGNVFGRQWYEDHKSGLLAKEQPGVYAAAGAYFDAHPEPKPWHDAKPGEVWLLTSNGGLYIDEPAVFDGRQFVFCSRVERNTIDTATADGIRGARRIWPEVSS